MDFSSYQILDSILAAFVNAANTGFNLLSGEVFYLTSALMLMAILFTGYKIMFGDSSEIVTAGKRLLLWTVIIYLTNTWADNTDLIRQTALELGIRASGSSNAVSALSPSRIVDLGAEQMGTLLEVASAAGGILGIVGAPMDTLILTIAGLVIFIAFLIVALQLMITIIEFKLLTLASFILIPFGILTRTSFLMERALGYVASSALKFLTLAFVLSITVNIVQDFALNAHQQIDIDVGTGLRMMAVAIVIAGLSITIPAAAASLITGGPSLGVGALAGGAAVGAAVGVGAAGAGAAAVSGGRAGLTGGQGMMERVQAAFGAGSPPLSSAGSLVGKGAGVSAGAAASQAPRGGIGETTPQSGEIT